MTNKTLLVASREYGENLKTKTFWIGILMFPIILILSLVVPRLFDRAKEARRYTVIDNSGFMLDAIEKRAQFPDLEKVFEKALEWREKDEAKWKRLPIALQETVNGIVLVKDLPQLKAGLDAHPELKEGTNETAEASTARLFAQFISTLGTDEGVKFRDVLPQESLDQLDALREQISDWWKKLPSGEAREFGRDMSRARYTRVEPPPNGEVIAELNRKVGNNELFAYFVIGEDPVHSDEGHRYVSNNLTDNDLRQWFERLATEEARDRRLAEKNIEKAVSQWIQKPVSFDEKQVGEGGVEKTVETEDKALKFAPVVFVYLLWIAVFMIAQMLLTNTVEEKSNRILEVLLSSVTPLQLMNGKILGIAATGLTMILSWVGFFVLTVQFLPMIGFEFPFPLTPIITNPSYLTAFVGYFLGGYMFFAALFVGVGSVCTSLKEAQNLIMPVTLVLMVPLMAMIPVVQDPNGNLAKALSWIPPFTPFVMMNRAAGPPTTLEYVGTSIVLALSVVLTMWGAAKIFRIGVLMTGKAPTPLEIFRWLRAPVGQVPVRKDAAEPPH